MIELLQSTNEIFNGWVVACSDAVCWRRYCWDSWNQNQGFTEFCIKVTDTTAARFERTGSNFKRNSIHPVGKCYQTALHAKEKSFMKGRVNRYGKLHCCLIFRNRHSLCPGLPSATTLSSQQPSTWGQDSVPAKKVILRLTESSDDVQHFLAIKYFLIKVCTLFLDSMLLHI